MSLNDNAREAWEAISDEWTPTNEVAKRIPRHGRINLVSAVYTALRRLERDGYVESRRTQGNIYWRKKQTEPEPVQTAGEMSEPEPPAEGKPRRKRKGKSTGD